MKRLSWLLLIVVLLGAGYSSSLRSQVSSSESRDGESGESDEPEDKGPPLVRSVITAKLPNRSISALVTHLEIHKPFKRMIILMVGYPSIIKIKSAHSYGMKMNFLMRTASDWLDPETVTVALDAPTDQWSRFEGSFKASARYAEDIAALYKEIETTFGKLPLAIVGTSEGCISAYYVALTLQQQDTKVILTSTLFNTTRNSQGMTTLDMSKIKAPILWVHHASDPCNQTPYTLAKKMAEQTHSPLITVYSTNPGMGDPCRATSRHGFYGVESEVVAAIRNWIFTGEAKDVHGR